LLRDDGIKRGEEMPTAAVVLERHLGDRKGPADPRERLIWRTVARGGALLGEQPSAGSAPRYPCFTATVFSAAKP
jgi:hypothetical protein